jgi:sugar phosphate isomerase/epimerase
VKLAFSSNAYTNYSLVESIDEISALGYKGIEILCDRPHAFPLPMDKEKIRILKVKLKEKNLEISNLNAFTLFAVQDTYHPSWIEDDEDYRQVRIDHTINCIRLAHELGAKNISVEPGGPSSYSIYKEKHMKIFVEGLNKVLPFAEENDVKILVEPEPELLLETSGDFLELVKNFSSKYIGLNFDIGHFYCVNEDPAKLVFELKDYFSHIHFADIKNRIHNHLIPGLGSIDFKQVLQALKEIRYDGFVTVELYPYKEKPTEAAKQSIDYINGIIKQLDIETTR